MKQWLETRQVLDRLAELEREGQQAALATVVRVRGSAYRHEGAKMLVAADGTTVGNVSGGCLEADVREVAMQVVASGEAARREYCGSADEIAAWDLGVGCEGMVDVSIERVSRSDDVVWNLARASLTAHEPFALCSDLTNGARACVTATEVQGSASTAVVSRARTLLVDGASGIQPVEGRDVFIDILTPPPVLVIVSAADDARQLARFANDVGFHVLVVDRRPGYLDPSRFPSGTSLVEARADNIATRVSFGEDSYAVVMMHSYADDREYVRALLGAACPYIGMLGPRQRTERIINELSAIAAVDESRIYGPVGLDIGTDGAEQVALAVIAEILAVRSGRNPASLRERRHPIHTTTSG